MFKHVTLWSIMLFLRPFHNKDNQVNLYGRKKNVYNAETGCCGGRQYRSYHQTY